MTPCTITLGNRFRNTSEHPFDAVHATNPCGAGTRFDRSCARPEGCLAVLRDGWGPFSGGFSGIGLAAI